ncbi:hypothetical protein ACFLUC_01970, partial [Chloroflexota bacterium]
KDHPGQKIMLEIWEDRLDITDLSRRNLYSSSAPDILGGLTEDANKKPKNFTGRTFVGIDDRNGDKNFETLIILNTLTARQVDAAGVVREFGADKVIQFDGGGSTQLTCHDRPYVGSERIIPQSIGVSAGIVPPLEADIVSQPDWAIVTLEEPLDISIEIINTGTETWQGDKYQMVLENKNWGEEIKYKFPRPVPYKDQIKLSWTTIPFSEVGVFSTNIYLEHGSDLFPSQPEHFYTVVIPASLEGKRNELEQIISEIYEGTNLEKAVQIRAWIHSEIAGLPQETREVFVLENLVEQQSESTPESAPNLNDAGWIPLIILPIAVIILIVVVRKQRRDF